MQTVRLGNGGAPLIEDLATLENNTNMYLAPDGAGGVVWQPVAYPDVEALPTAELNIGTYLAPDGAGGLVWRVLGAFTEQLIQEMHKVTAGEVAAGFFTLAQIPVNTPCVEMVMVNGIRQINKQCVGGTGAVPDFEVLAVDQKVYIRNNGGTVTGLSEDIITDDILIIDYHM